VRRGDVIPKIVAKIADGGRRQPILKPTVCPVTGGPVGHRTNVDGTPSAVLYSLSPNNPAVLKGKIERWVKSLDIQGLGETFISELVDRGVLKDVADLYTLWAPVRRFELESVLGYARAASVLEEIDKKQVLTLAEFLGSLGIHGLGKRRVALVQAKDPGQFNTLGDWTSGKLVTRAAEAGLPKAAPVIQQQIKDAEQLIAELQTAGVKIMEKTEVAPVKAGALTFCLTGKFSSPKAFYHERITAAGHRFEESYRKGLSFLVAADPSSNSAKLKKAEKDGVSVISDTKLLEMLQ
jgi:DNA ligase (NAD+)